MSDSASRAEADIWIRWLPALVLAGLLVGCGGGSAASSQPPPSAAPATPAPTVTGSDPGVATMPRRVTPADDGRTYTMQIGGTAGLIVGDPNAPDVVVDGTSVTAHEIVNIAASGQREWELRAVDVGRTVLRGGGAQPYAITIEVVGS